MRIFFMSFILASSCLAQNQIPFPQTHFWLCEPSGTLMRSKVFGVNGDFETRVLVEGEDQGVTFTERLAARSIDLDEPRGKVYWVLYKNADTTTSNIFRANLDGSEFETFVSFDGVISGIQIDSVNARVYWVESEVATYFSRIVSTNLDGGDETVHFDSNGLDAFGFGDTPLFWDLALNVEDREVWFYLRGTTVERMNRSGRFVGFNLDTEQLFLETEISEKNLYPVKGMSLEEEILFYNIPSIALDPDGQSNVGSRQTNFAATMSLDNLFLGEEGAGFTSGGDSSIFGIVGFLFTDAYFAPGTSNSAFQVDRLYFVSNPVPGSVVDPLLTTLGRITQIGLVGDDFGGHMLVGVPGQHMGTFVPHMGEPLSIDADFIEADFQDGVMRGYYPEDVDNDGFPETAALALLLAAYADYGEPLLGAIREDYDHNIATLTLEELNSLSLQREYLAALFLLGSDVKEALIGILADDGTTLMGEYVSVDVDDFVRDGTEPFSGSGDVDGDGVSNLDEYVNTIAAGGSVDDFVESALDAGSAGGDSGGGGGGGCIIATHANSSALSDEVDAIRSFRDSVLLRNSIGTALSNAYYRTSQWILRSH